MNELPRTRHSLLLRLKDQSHDAWNEFLDVYQNAIIRFAEKKGLQNADALDVTQEVLCAVEKKLKDWDSDPSKGKFRGWLFRVVRNIAVDRIKTRIRQPISNKDICLEEVSESSPDPEQFQSEFQKQVLFWAAKKIQPRFSKSSWDAFWLTAIEGLPVSEVSNRTGLTAGKIYAAKFRVTAQIKAVVKRFDDTENFPNTSGL